jgi:hypothetical protein
VRLLTRMLPDRPVRTNTPTSDACGVATTATDQRYVPTPCAGKPENRSGQLPPHPSSRHAVRTLRNSENGFAKPVRWSLIFPESFGGRSRWSTQVPCTVCG